mgnify:CR=1 FL=1|nr:MAG TPA: hypothetical protein [Caudoviricetes sp.]
MALPYSLEAYLLGRERSIMVLETKGGGAASTSIIPDVVVSEEHSDEVILTRHPVDRSAPVSDHAYKLPATVTCVFAWSDSSRLINSIMNASILKGLQTTKDVYKKFQELMTKRQLLRLCTGKRVYENVLLTKMSTTSTADTESSLVLELTFEEVNLVTIAETTLSAATQKDASRTASTSNGGTRSGVPA